MRGHIRKRGNKYAIVVDAGRTAEGKRIRKWHSGYRTRKDAELALPDILRSINSGDYVAPSKRTVDGFMTEWLASTKPTLRPNTYIGYERANRHHIAGEFVGVPLQGLTHGAVAAWHARLIDKGLKPSSIRKIHFILRKALQDAMRWNYLSRNVAALVRPPTLSGYRPQLSTWTADEVRTFLEHVRDDRLHAAWMLAATTGMRRGEVLGLQWRSVDLDAARLSVSQTLVAPSHEFEFAEPKTASGRRQIALDRHTVPALRQHRRRQLEERILLGEGYDDQDLVFAMEDGTPIFPRQFSKWFREHLQESGLTRIRLHDLRHTHATLSLRAGVHVKVVSERLGHASIKITLDTYMHAIPAMQEEAAEQMASLVFGTSDGSP